MPISIDEATPRPPSKAEAIAQAPATSHHHTRPTAMTATTTTPPRPLPALPSKLVQRLQDDSLKVPVNDECTSLAITPSGRFILGGFSDGTVRVFDLAERFVTGQFPNKQKKKLGVFYGSESSMAPSEPTTATNSTGIFVCSHFHQQFGAVAGQIHARGVHTSLRLQVAVSQDGLYCFAGVTRGSMELLVVHLGYLEEVAAAESSLSSDTDNLLDYLSVYRHADAKLRGFGACAKLQHSSKYLLLCGKGIKNIHVWSFSPPTAEQPEPGFELVYNCVTNGNSITLLNFRHVGPNQLFAVSKSQQQKLRVWDLSHEETESEEEPKRAQRPSRPPFFDVANTEATLGIAGGFCLCGGSDYHFNQMSIVSLEDVRSTYNHTELALPGVDAQASFGRRQQRGDLKSVEAVAGMAMDGGHALLELNDRTLVQYTHHGGGCLPMLKVISDSDLPEGWSRTMAVGRIGASGLAVAAVAVHNPFTGRGNISLWPMERLTGLDHPRTDLACAGIPTIPRPDTLLKLKAAVALQSDPTKAIATKIHPVTTTKKTARPREAVFDDDSSSSSDAEFPRMRDLTNASSAEKASTGKTSRTVGRVSLDGTEAAPLLRRSPPTLTALSRSDISPELQRLDRPRKETFTALPGSIAKVKKVKHPESRRPSLDSVSSTQSTTVTKRSANRRHSDNASIASSGDKPRKKVKRIAPLSPVPHSPIIPKKSYAVPKPGLLALPQALDLSTGSLSPVPPRRSKYVDYIQSPVFSPKQQQRQPRNEDLQRVIREKCTEQQEKLLHKLSEFPTTSVSARLGFQTEVVATVDEIQDRQRRLLAAEHLAAHERLAKTILRAAYDILESVQRSPFLQSLESARDLLRVTLLKFRASLDQQMRYQQLQAEELASKQTWERQGDNAPTVQVAFPFSSVFEQASDSLPQLIR